MKTITIKDVAARAGVSPKTVSRVINSESYVRPELRATVQKVVEELGYRPNAFARELSSSRSFLLGLFFDDPASPYAADLQRGALARCRELSYHLVVEQLDRECAGWLEECEASLRAVRLGGAVLTPPLCDWEELLDLFERYAVPVVRISPGDDLERTSRVEMDDRGAAREMTEQLLALGHRDIAFVQGNPTHHAAARRLEGFRAAMAAAGLPVPASRALQGDFTFRSGLEAAERLLGGGERPSAVFAANDEMALAILVAAMRIGIAVPEQLSIAGFDDSAIARMAWPQLSTVRQPNFEMAATAVDLLTHPQRAAGSTTPETCLLPHAVVMRASTAAAAGAESAALS
ncbi:LacI family DNA-binding transcriptional regulator [Sphingomonas psychrotolerans]|uniref:LacI family DNA-binding transcriptional regulator n=1 Tax=Sphingomonas psychrotolerans TaxID=1327635 RepID=A0ABU3NAK1_9SPHN|nr:LacI family DNA-binding transcriptional regulator [Sphingomonas psychrotolerans]MDT8760914.1 LacI family DNA-binding transcriptional regulator [Sphingomonas psychrotolerans]